MATTHSTDTRFIPDGAAPPVNAARIDRAGVYLTDETFLYRVVGVVPSPAGVMVELEDCLYLDVVRVRLADVRARRLRAVTPAAIHA